MSVGLPTRKDEARAHRIPPCNSANDTQGGWLANDYGLEFRISAAESDKVRVSDAVDYAVVSTTEPPGSVATHVVSVNQTKGGFMPPWFGWHLLWDLNALSRRAVAGATDLP